MRKVSITTSQDGGDSTSITSGIENEIKRAGAAIIKAKKSSFKRKVQSFSHESDDGVVEPLLQKGNEKVDNVNQSSKFALSKTKTDSISEKGDDKDKLLADNKGAPSMTSVPGVTSSQHITNGFKDNQTAKSYSSAAPIHNHMNINVFASQENKSLPATKSQVLVEIIGSKQKEQGASPLIFTTAKIHMDSKTKPLEPVQVTAVPILSTVEGDVIKTSAVNNIKDNSSAVSCNRNDNLQNDGTTSISTSNTTRSSGSTVPIDTTSAAPCKLALNSPIVTTTQQPLSKPSIQLQFSVQNNVNITSSTATKTPYGSQSPNDKTSSFETTAQKSVIANSGTVKTTAVAKEIESVAGISNPALSETRAEDKPSTTVVKTRAIVNSDSREVTMDINKNIQTTSASNVTSQYPEVSISVNNKNRDSGDKISRTTSNSPRNKSLKRQKKALVEDTKVSDTTTSGTITKNVNNESIDSGCKEKTSMPLTITKKTEPKICKMGATTTLPNTSANNVASNVSTPSTKITAVSTSEIKTNLQTSATITKTSMMTPTSTIKQTSAIKPISQSSAAGNAGTQSTISATKVTNSNTTTSSTKPTSTKSVTKSGSSADKVPSTVSNKQVNSSTGTAAKTSALKSTTSSIPQAKPLVVSTVKTIMSDTSVPKSIANSSFTPVSSKKSTVTTMKALPAKEPSVAKPAQVKYVVGVAKSNIKQSDTKHSDSKEDKSKA